MSESSSVKDKELKYLGELFGFLAIVLGLLIPVVLDEMKKEDISIKDKLFYIMSIEIIFLILIGICSFYFFRYQKKDKIAEIIGIMILGAFFLVIDIILHPLVPHILSSINPVLEKRDLFILINLISAFILFIVLVSIGSAYYVYAFGRVRRKAKKDEKK